MLMRYRITLILPLLLVACSSSKASSTLPTESSPQALTPGAVSAPTPTPSVPRAERWGIYWLEIESQKVELLFSSPTELSYLRLNYPGDRFAFSQKVGGDADTEEEIFTLGTDGRDLRRITDNAFWDLYPVWSPDDQGLPSCPSVRTALAFS